MIPYSKNRKSKPPAKAAMVKAEKAENPSDESRESAAIQRLEARMGVEKHKGGK